MSDEYVYHDGGGNSLRVTRPPSGPPVALAETPCYIDALELSAWLLGPSSGPWYAVENDLIGGWDVSPYDKPMSQHDTRAGEHSIGSFLSEAHAKHIANLLNYEPIDKMKYIQMQLDQIATLAERGLPVADLVRRISDFMKENYVGQE